MLPLIYREALMRAAEVGEKNSTERLAAVEAATERLKGLVPQYFFQGDKDPALKQRVFHHQPHSMSWSGTAVNAHKAWGGKDLSLK